MTAPAEAELVRTVRRASLPRDVASAYLVTLARIGSWVLVSAMVYRRMGAGPFAVLALVRATVGVFNYASLGIAPAMVHLLARLQSAAAPVEVITPAPLAPAPAPADGAPAAAASAPSVAPTPEAKVDRTRGVLAYASPQANQPPMAIVSPLQSLYYSGFCILLISALIGAVLLAIYVSFFSDGVLRTASGLRAEIGAVVMLMGAGVLLRMLSDAPGAVLQTGGRITLDNLLLAWAELVWLALAAWWMTDDPDDIVHVATAFAAASMVLLFARAIAAETVAPILNVRMTLDWKAGRQLLAFGLLVTLAQAADYLYAPTDYLLINQLLGPQVVAVYAPAVQIDGGLLVLVTALSSVILPRAATADAAGRHDLVRRYYIWGTLATAAMLTLVAACVWMTSPWIFQLWLDDPMRPTQLILPLVLIHTVVGGSSAIGRAILLGTGKVKAFTIAALVSGAANVLLSYLFVRYLDLGLKGIVYGTILAVIARAGIWMPWYVLRELRNDATSSFE